MNVSGSVNEERREEVWMKKREESGREEETRTNGKPSRPMKKIGGVTVAANPLSCVQSPIHTKSHTHCAFKSLSP